MHGSSVAELVPKLKIEAQSMQTNLLRQKPAASLCDTNGLNHFHGSQKGETRRVFRGPSQLWSAQSQCSSNLRVKDAREEVS